MEFNATEFEVAPDQGSHWKSENEKLNKWFLDNKESFKRIGSSTMINISTQAMDTDYILMDTDIPEEFHRDIFLGTYWMTHYKDAFARIIIGDNDFTIFKDKSSYEAHLFANNTMKNMGARFIKLKKNRIEIFEQLKHIFREGKFT